VSSNDGFAAMVDDAKTFFAELDLNNTKDWFEPRKNHYARTIRQPAELLAELVTDSLSRMTRVGHAGKVYRIHRDVRFSKDKRPYNAHLHILWSSKGTGEGAPAWFFACSPAMLTLNMGVPFLQGEALARYRKMVDSVGDELQEALSEVGLGFSSWGEEPLKKVPPPFAADHPHGALLRRRSLILDAPLGDGWRGGEQGLLGAIEAEARRMLLVWSFLHEHLG
jgi:uncharacterized protein (TIGR02453 family)